MNDELSGEFTSARLRRVEQERDEIRAAFDTAEESYLIALEDRAKQITELQRERDELRDHLTKVLDEVQLVKNSAALARKQARDALAELEHVKRQLSGEGES